MKTILIVEDHVSVAERLQRSLKRLHYHALEIVTTGIEALASAGQYHPDLVLMDIQLPGDLNGIETARQIAERFAIPSLFMTAADDEQTLQQAKQTNPVGYILKPVEERDLHIALEMAFAKLEVEQRLRESKEQWERTFEAVPDLITLIDDKFRIMRANSALAERLHVTVGQCAGQTCYELIHGLTHPPDFCPHARLLMSGQSQQEEVYELRLGGYFIVTVSPLHDASGNLLGSVHVAHDITRRKQTEEILRLNEERLTALLELYQMHDASEQALIDFALEAGVKLTSSAGGYFHFFDADQNTLGLYAWSKAVLTHCSAQKTSHYPLSEAGVWADCVRLRQPVIHNDYQHLPNKRGLPDGHFPLVRHLCIPVFDGERVVALIGVSNKLTPYDQADIRQLSLFMSSLWTIVKRRRAEEALKHAKEDADAANRAKSEFLAHISHELRTPLNGILGYAQLLKRDQHLTEEQHHFIETIHRSGDHLLTIINDILDLSKIEAGRIDLEPTTFALSTMVQTLVDMMQVRTEQKGVAFIYHQAPDLPRLVKGDEKRLRQVLLNLLGNAIKFTEHGQVELRITPCAVRNDHAAPCHLKFEILDTGIGIPADKLQAIFNPFEQVADHRFKTEGSGLGLAISLRLVEKMGGCLSVESTPGQGSRFWFEIPLSDAQDAHLESHSIPLPSSGKAPIARIIGIQNARPTILIVDDDQNNRELLSAILQPVGFHLIEAATGQECLTYFQRARPDLILMDLIMPEMDGFETTRQIREAESSGQKAEGKDTAGENNDNQKSKIKNQKSKIPIIALSASAFEHTRQQSREAGCDDFLTKPVEHDILLEYLQRALKLTWMYADQPSPSSKTPPGVAPVAIIPPPPDVLEALIQAAEIGDILEIQKIARQQESVDMKFAPFTRKLRQLADELQISAIRKFLHNYNDIH